jgi:hypothetical protein
MDTLFRQFGSTEDPEYYRIAALGGVLGDGVLLASLGIARHATAPILAAAQVLQHLASRAM